MIVDGPDSVTTAVLAAMAGGHDPRLRAITASFVRHVHAFVREVGLTEKEWDAGVSFLNRIGVSTLVCLLNNGNNGGAESASAPGTLRSAASTRTRTRSRRP